MAAALLPKSFKGHEVLLVATVLKVDLWSILKAGRWLIWGTLNSFYLRDLCSQVDELQKVGHVVAGHWEDCYSHLVF